MSAYKLTLLGKLTLTLLITILVMIIVLVCSSVFSKDTAGAALDNGDTGGGQGQTTLFDKPLDLPLNASSAVDGEGPADTDAGVVDADAGDQSSPDKDGTAPEQAADKDDGQPQGGVRTPTLVVYFGPDSDVVTQEGYDSMDAFLKGRDLSGYSVILEGNAFRREMYLEEYTRELSRSRAEHVADCLREFGVPGDSITVVANGGDNAVPPDESGSYWMTRRVEIYLASEG